MVVEGFRCVGVGKGSYVCFWGCREWWGYGVFGGGNRKVEGWGFLEEWLWS